MVLCGRCGEPCLLLLPLALTLLYFCGLVVSVVNTVYLRRRRNLYGGALINAHLSFCVISAFVFFFLSAVTWFWSFKYASNHAERIWRLSVGLWFMFLFRDLPLLIIETQAFLLTGWRNGSFADASLILQIIFFVGSALASWTTIAWYLAGFLERQLGSAAPVDREGKSDKIPMAPQVCMQLAAATEHPPSLPIQDMHYILANPPRQATSAENPSWSNLPSDFNAAAFAAPPPHTASVHQHNVSVRNFEGSRLVGAKNDLRALASEDDVGPHPAVI
ncbi:hypothetical protein LSCM1_00687 [Leishmania martiniquensis]|uniref:Transmembrane protein n=1 Tax=Leishmania martiniquensis TaxID=1580590 RepID=A0A836KA26_9TRYP|nr:hypothetical protein LSCM1_00687 [Leishmania martiniquensis]